ncbi:LysE family translocator [Fundidesulfovibrio putealis]|uniref:LysE family translocator n=1 Tax=Fundidesulfovibrio putealis TaxID=270496 RepID=UPI0003F8772B|nr:LysE family translocator [Fundidesulfovibrio putealis]
MPLDTYLAFVAASSLLLIIPGPTVMLVVGFALSYGARRASWSAVGVMLGDATALSCSLLGLGAFLQTSAHLFSILKWAGALYLIWMGVKMIKGGGNTASHPSHSSGAADIDPIGASPPSAARPASNSRMRMVLQAYVVTALNPKTLLFFVAFVPQFITPGPDVHTQMLIILATFVGLAFLNVLAYAALAGSARRAARDPGVLRAFNRLGGCTFIGAGLWTAAREAS